MTKKNRRNGDGEKRRKARNVFLSPILRFPDSPVPFLEFPASPFLRFSDSIRENELPRREPYCENEATTGVWSEAPFPLRASRSIRAPVQRAARGCVTK